MVLIIASPKGLCMLLNLVAMRTNKQNNLNYFGFVFLAELWLIFYILITYFSRFLVDE